MFTGIEHSHLWVKDLDRAIAYYRDDLGLDVVHQSKAQAYLAAGEGCHFILKQAPPDLAVETQHLAFKVPSVDAVYQALEARGVPLERPPGIRPDTHYRPRQKHLLWRDPDGILLEVSEP
jgi:catechol 2,3-dioxygenase-like lactoylglutathione lyase family enzyme